MRKLLLGTSALIGATALVASASAAAPELTVSGNLNFEWVGGEGQANLDNVVSGTNDRGHAESGWNFEQANSVSEIKFFAEGESDGGLTYGADIQYRYLNDTTDNGSAVDEAYIFVGGDWGTLHLGQDDGAVNQTRFYAGSIAPGGYLIDGWSTALAPKSIRSYSDANKILYVSNDLSGFKFALSVEEAQDAGTAVDLAALGATYETTRAAAAGGSATAAQTTAATTAAQALAAGINDGGDQGVQYEDQYEIGASYTHDFGDGHVGLSVGYQTADIASDDAGGDDDYEDREEYIVGFKAGFGALSFAGSYADAGDSGLTQNEQRDGAEAPEIYTLGVAYDLGGGMAVGVSYAEKDRTAVSGVATAADNRTGLISSDITEELITIDFGFPIMTGMAGYAGIAFSEVDTTTRSYTANDTSTSANASADGTTYVIGTTVSF